MSAAPVAAGTQSAHLGDAVDHDPFRCTKIMIRRVRASLSSVRASVLLLHDGKVSIDLRTGRSCS